MKKVIFVLSLFSMHASFASDHIVNGHPVASSNVIAKSVVAFLSQSSEAEALCTASLIAPDLAVTAAHCVKDASPAPKAQFTLIFNKDIHASGAVTRTIDQVEVPTEWKPNSKNQVDTWDVALVHFSGGLPEGYEASDLLPAAQDPKNGDEVTIAGYGITNATSNAGAGVLRQTQVKVLNADYSPTEIEFDQTGGGACNGDSGGPAYVMADKKPMLFGITSRGSSDCKQDAIYSKISAYADWFKSAEAKMHAQKE